MKCYFTTDTETGEKVLIPNCWAVVMSNDIKDCYCTSKTFAGFERERYNEMVNKLREEIKEHERIKVNDEKTIYRLTQQILKLKNSKE